MLKKDQLVHFINKQCRLINHRLAAYCASGEGEELHRLRVEVKKINALVYLLQNCSGEKGQKLNDKPLKAIFKQAGLIRTAQVNLQVVTTHHLTNAEFTKAQQKVVEEETAKLCQHADHYQQSIKKAKGHLEDHCTHVKNKDILQLYQKQLQKLGLYFSVSFNADELHEVRKEVKDLLYNHALLPPAVVASLQLNTAYLDELQHAIGQWHDTLFTLQILTDGGFNDASLMNHLQQQSGGQLTAIQSIAEGFTQKVVQPVTTQ